MLNLSFSSDALGFDDSTYVLPDELVSQVVQNNQQTTSGPELRLQDIYTFEISRTLKNLGYFDIEWQKKRVLDICCGTGFLSYHLLKQNTLGSLTLLDISLAEVVQAKELITHQQNSCPHHFLVSDALQMGLEPGQFDIVIGNSFLHHFHNLPDAIQSIRAWLKPGGIFITLHEPTPSAVPLESGRMNLWLRYILFGRQALEAHRYAGSEMLGAADVWMFDPKILQTMFRDAGFTNIRTQKQRILRSLIVGKMNLHLNATKPVLHKKEEGYIKFAIVADKILSYVLPSNWFGSFSLIAQRR